MTSSSRRDLIAGLVLFVVAVGWTVTAHLTIRDGFGGEVGPRAFPVLLGALLAVLSLILVVQSLVRPPGRGRGAADAANGAAGDDAATSADVPVSRIEVVSVASVIVSLLAYGYLLPRLGFLLATPLLITALLWLGLRVRNPWTIGLFAAGMTAGCYVVFNKLMGAYLPPGNVLPAF